MASDQSSVPETKLGSILGGFVGFWCGLGIDVLLAHDHIDTGGITGQSIAATFSTTGAIIGSRIESRVHYGRQDQHIEDLEMFMMWIPDVMIEKDGSNETRELANEIRDVAEALAGSWEAKAITREQEFVDLRELHKRLPRSCQKREVWKAFLAQRRKQPMPARAPQPSAQQPRPSTQRPPQSSGARAPSLRGEGQAPTSDVPKKARTPHEL